MGQLQELRRKIQQAESELNRLEGQRDTHLEQLKEFDCGSLEDAQDKLEQLETELEERKANHEKTVEQFKEKYQL